MNKQSFFFYDLETSGLSARDDRVMQFAGQRTDMDLNPIGEEVNILVKMQNDTLPSPGAILVTGITPQSTIENGMTEAEFCHYLQDNIFTENTIAVGFNSVRFDDEFMRHTFWRNFYDPYEWEWKDGRSRWDILDLVRMTRALRPEGIVWPFREDGKPTNRLELITKLNGIEHEHAHDALADVYATIAVAKLIKEKQPSLFKYLLDNRDKRILKQKFNLENPEPFVYASGRYSAEFNNTTVVFPLAPGKNGNILVYDLRYNINDVEKDLEEVEKQLEGLNKTDQAKKLKELREAGKITGYHPIVKEMAYNKCPAIAPLAVLTKADGWQKIGLTEEKVKENLEALKKYSGFAEKMMEKFNSRPEFPPPIDPESALYDSFLPEGDKIRVNAVRNANENDLADFHPNFSDERLPELLLHYKAKNFPRTLDENEEKKWEEYRLARLKRQEPKFIKELEMIGRKIENGEITQEKSFIVEELKLWYESLAPES